VNAARRVSLKVGSESPISIFPCEDMECLAGVVDLVCGGQTYVGVMECDVVVAVRLYAYQTRQPMSSMLSSRGGGLSTHSVGAPGSSLACT